MEVRAVLFRADCADPPGVKSTIVAQTPLFTRKGTIVQQIPDSFLSIPRHQENVNTVLIWLILFGLFSKVGPKTWIPNWSELLVALLSPTTYYL